MTVSFVKCSQEFDMSAIASAAGNDNVEARWYSPGDGGLYVRDVTQAALDNALANYDDGPNQAARAKGAAEMELISLDHRLPRVVEDLLDTLFSKGVLSQEDIDAMGGGFVKSRKNRKQELRDIVAS